MGRGSVEQRAKPGEDVLTRLAKLLYALSAEDPHSDEIESLKETIREKLTALNTAVTAYAELKGRDPTHSNPLLQGQYDALVGRTEEVLTYCKTQLHRDLRKLEFLAGPDKDELDKIRESVRKLSSEGVPESGTPIAAREPTEDVSQSQTRITAREPAEDALHSETRTAAREPAAQMTQVRREFTTAETPGEPSVVTVSRGLLSQLESHEKRLEGYLKVYIRCQALAKSCGDHGRELEDAPAQALRKPFLERVGTFLNDLSRMVAELRSAFKTDLDQPVTILDEAVSEARILVKDTSRRRDPGETAESLTGYLNKMHEAFPHIDAHCSDKVQETCRELRDVINQIFGLMKIQREAQVERTTERSGAYATKEQQPMGLDRVGRSPEAAEPSSPQAGASARSMKGV